MKYFPINVDIHNRRVVVIGGGAVAARKVMSLLDCGARVRVISIDFCPELLALDDVEREQRPYAEGDLAGACLVVCATNSEEVNRAVRTEAEQRGIFCNVVDQPEYCSFTVPSMLCRGDLLLTVSTGGVSPSLSARLRRQLENQVSPAFETHLKLLGVFRPRVKASGLSIANRSCLLKAMAGEDITRLIERDGEMAAYVRLEQMLTGALDH